MSVHLGFYNTSSTRTHVRFQFSTHAASGANVAPSSSIDAADIRIYKATDGAAFSATQRSSSSGITCTSPFDSLTGFHDVDIDLTDNTDASFYVAGFYSVVLAPSDETIDSLVITGKVLAYFEIGVSKADVTQFGGTAGTFASGRPEVNTTHAAGTAWGSGAITAASIASDAITDAKVASDVTIASVTGAVGSVTGAVGSVTGNVGGNVTGSVGSVVGAVGSVTGAVGSVTGNVGGNVTGSVGSVATGGISAASFAAGAIDAAAIAANAIGASELAADAVTEIAAGISIPSAATIASQVRTELTTELARIDVASSTLATAVNLATVAGYLDTEIAAIKAKTDNLPSDPADASDVAAAITAAWTTALTESYATDGSTATPAQLLYMLWSAVSEFSISGTTITAKKLDGSTTAMTFTIDSSTDPTSRTRAS